MAPINDTTTRARYSECAATTNPGRNQESTIDRIDDPIGRIMTKFGIDKNDCKRILKETPYADNDTGPSPYPPPKDLRSCGVRATYNGCRFDNYEDTSGKLVEDLRAVESESVILSGPTGCGKTHLAVALMAESGLGNREMIFIKSSWLLQLLRDTNNKNSTERLTDLFEKYCSIPLLVLDDMGAEKGTDYVSEMIGELIDWRDAEGNRTVITTNLSMGEISAKYGDRTASRLSTWEYCRIAKADYRKKKKKIQHDLRVVNGRQQKSGGDNEGSTTAEAVK